MSRTGDLWLLTYESACAQYTTGATDDVAFVGDLRQLGMVPDDIADHLDVLTPERAKQEPDR